MKTFYFLALAVMAIAEPSPEEIAAINNAEEPQSAKGHKIDKREAMPGYGPKIDVDMEINAGQRARVNIDIDVNIETEKMPKEGNDGHTAPNEGPTTSDEYSTLSDISMVAWGQEGWWENAVVNENYHPPGYRSYGSPYANAHCPSRSDLSGQTPCKFECRYDDDCPNFKLCCSNDCGRVCVTPEIRNGPARCGCSFTFFSDLSEFDSSPADIARVVNFVWNVLQGSLSPSLEPHLLFDSMNRNWLGPEVRDDCLMELMLQNKHFHYTPYDPFSMENIIMFAIITDANSTFMRDYVDYFPDVFDAFNVIQVGDVDPEGKLDAAAEELQRVDSLDDLADFVEAAKEIIENFCSCDDVMPEITKACLEPGDPCEGECNRFAFVCEEGKCQRDATDPAPPGPYRSYFDENEDDDYYIDYDDEYFEFYNYYDTEEYIGPTKNIGGLRTNPQHPRNRNESQQQSGDAMFPKVVKQKNNSPNAQPNERGNKKTKQGGSSACTKPLYLECNGYLSMRDKENCKRHKRNKNCTEPGQVNQNKKLSVLDEGPKRYLYRTLDYTGQCRGGLFPCSGIPSLCLYGELLCNGENDCMFGEDEDGFFCLIRECSATEFRCNSGQCVRKEKECDGKIDCSDGTDEHCGSGDDCPTPRTYYCGSGTACIIPTFKCDNILDCPNGEDEAPCNCTGFKCRSGECIDEYFLCNGRDDCKDGSDEVPEECENFICQESYFKCGSNECIPKHKVCDCIEDCKDKSDENDCTSIQSPDKWKCDSGQCISKWDICDGYVDCVDQSDEKYCTDLSCDGFACDSGYCISHYERCNLYDDCDDGSDEYDCSNHTCLSYHFQCGTGHCIYSSMQCDGREDCPDGSDEAACDSSESCNAFQCSSGKCIYDYEICDGVYHCHDRKDESVCQYVSCPPHRPHKCDSGQCIPSSPNYNPRCNGIKDCHDGSDELDCGDVQCPPEMRFQCGSGECIPDHYVCDHFGDCADYSDERNCSCKDYQFRCDSGRCISSDFQCDGIQDCLGGFDEIGCNNFICPSLRPFKCGLDICLSDSVYCNEMAECPGDVYGVCQNKTCKSYEYQCASGECVYGHQCDGRIDCGDRSDEASCQNFECPPSRPFKCGSGECISQHVVCNGYPDCKDASDESFCSNETCLYGRKFYCTSGECIYADNVCDGYDDCRDGSDETATCEIFCPDNFNICNDSRCFPPNWICDSYEDCRNGEDERDCNNHERLCNINQFKCSYDNLCVPLSYVCDSFYDCGDGEDEMDCTPTTTTDFP